MVDFTEVVSWDDSSDLYNNLLYGLGRPSLVNLLVQREGLLIDSSGPIGKGVYKYDFGRIGVVTDFRFSGSPLLKFRLKTADTVSALNQAEFEGTETDRFSGNTIDLITYTPNANAYSLTQANGIRVTGTQSSTESLFTEPATLSVNTPLSDTYAASTSMRLVADTDMMRNSGSLSFLELSKGSDTIQVQKHYAQIRSKVVDSAGISLGRDVDNNDTILGESVNISINGTPTLIGTQLADGAFGVIEDQISSPSVTDVFENLKIVEEAVDFFEREVLDDTYVRILGIRADYSLTGILSDMESGLYYKPKRVHGYYAMRIPLVNPKIDLFANRITSSNRDLDSNEYVHAEVNDIWTTTILIDSGIHRYHFMVDGQRYTDSLNPTVIQTASGEESSLTLESTQFVQFVFSGKAEEVSLEIAVGGRVNEAYEMSVGADPNEVLKIAQVGETYYNNHSDWHKLEVEFEEPVPIVAVRFLGNVPLEHKQKIRILLDDNLITKDEWEIRHMPEDFSEPGVSVCAAYSNVFSTPPGSERLSYWDSNVDTVVASEDGWIEWHFLYDDPINSREIRSFSKFALLSRLENGSIFLRAHRGIEILVPSTFVSRVTDFLVSDDELEFRQIRETHTGPTGTWTIPQLVLQSGQNILTPMEILRGAETYGDPISVIVNEVKTFIEPMLGQSGVSLNNTEIACTLAAELTEDLAEVTEVVDIGPVGGPAPISDQRFTRESFTRSSDRLRVVVINIGIEPIGIYYVRVVGQPTNFRLELYETFDDAQNEIDRIGYAESIAYGFQELATFIVERQLSTPSGLVDVEVNNILACFDEEAADTIFETRPRANI